MVWRIEGLIEGALICSAESSTGFYEIVSVWVASEDSIGSGGPKVVLPTLLPTLERCDCGS